VIRHVSVITFTAGTPPDAVQSIADALAALPARVPSLRAYSFGPDLALTDGNAHFVVVADFDDVDGYLAYRDDAEHQRILRELIRPVLASRAAAQYDL
jgi:hypothetical protein